MYHVTDPFPHAIFSSELRDIWSRHRCSIMYTAIKLPLKPIKQLFLTDERRWESHLSADVWVASRHLLQRMAQCINLITGWLGSLTPMQHSSCYRTNRRTANQEMPCFLQKKMFNCRFQNSLQLFTNLHQIHTIWPIPLRSILILFSYIGLSLT